MPAIEHVNENSRAIILEVAREAALSAGSHLKSSFGKHINVHYKGTIDLVTQYDTQCQEIIENIIKNHFPRHSILGEEDLNVEKSTSLQWLIDPIDGTTNFSRSIPMYSVSVAFMAAGVMQVGVVYIPVLDELFYAVRGGGAFLNGAPIHVTGETDLGKSFLATGFPYDIRETELNNIQNFHNFAIRSLGIRRMGSAAIDLCYTAAGRFDGFWELKLKPWDTAAAALIVQEAGGTITDFSGAPFDPFMKECLASNTAIHSQMLDILSLK